MSWKERQGTRYFSKSSSGRTKPGVLNNIGVCDGRNGTTPEPKM